MDALWMGTWSAAASSEDEAGAAELRRGPWTADEDAVLANHVAAHGEGRWNELARAAGLRRTGKSCRLRWLNYLRPGVRRGDFAPREQLLILELHSRWGNRWSKIAAYLPGRTDNEVKNYWRTRVQKHAKQLRCDVGSRRFHDVVRHHWMPRLLERIHADAAAASAAVDGVAQPATTMACEPGRVETCASPDASCVTAGPSSSESSHGTLFQPNSPIVASAGDGYWSAAEQCKCVGNGSTTDNCDVFDGSWSELLARASHDEADSIALQQEDVDGFGETLDNFWSLDDMSLQQLC